MLAHELTGIEVTDASVAAAVRAVFDAAASR
jgi:hypothetical protein